MPTIIETINIEVEVWCAECGAGLCHQTEFHERGSKRGLHVEPCTRCLEAARQEGRDDANKNI